MRFERWLAAASLAMAMGSAYGQVPVPSVGLRVHLGYTTTNDFTLKDGTNAHLTGYELGVEFPVSKFSKVLTLNAYPSVLLGGKMGVGSLQGNVYRFMLSARATVPGSQFYSFIAGGVAHTQSGEGAKQFDDVSGYQTMVGGGLPLTGFLGHLSPSVEVAWLSSNRAQMRGVTIGVTASF